MTEPVSLDDIRVHLRIDDGADEDDYLSDLITAARRACEKRIGRSAVGGDFSLALDDFPRRPSWCSSVIVFDRALLDIDLPGGEVDQISSLTYLDATRTRVAVDPASYTACLTEQPARIRPIAAWPPATVAPGSIQITYSVLPLEDDDMTLVAQAIRLLVGSWYSNREAAVVDTRGVPTELPLSVTWLLEPVRLDASS